MELARPGVQVRAHVCVGMCVFQFVSLHGCVFFMWAIHWAQSGQCVPPRVLKCTLRTTGGFSPQ